VCAASSFLTSGEKWKLHPDWVYCEYNYAGQSGRAFDSPETNMVHFLQRLDQVLFNRFQISRISSLGKTLKTRADMQKSC
jgi:hypothetical protein